jgi:hypothetical protein
MIDASKNVRLRHQVRQHYSVLAHDPPIFNVAVSAMLDECTLKRFTNEEDASMWLERNCTRVLREVGLEVLAPSPDGTTIVTAEADGTKRVRITRREVKAARQILARNIAALGTAVALLLCFACGGPARPPLDAPAVTFTAQPWCYDLDHDGMQAIHILHLGVRADGKSGFRFDVEGDNDLFTLPGRYIQDSDAHMKIRVETGDAAAWRDIGVTLYTARGDEWVETDRRGSMPRCAP